MKKLILLLSLILSAQLMLGQTKTFGLDYLLFEKGLVLQELANEDFNLREIIQSGDSLKKLIVIGMKDKILEKALENYDKLIKDFPKSTLLYRTLNNKAFVELALDEKQEAKKTFLIIIKSNAKDGDKGGIGEGIMAEPYTNYKNRAAKTLANIFIEENNFTEAIKYLDLTKKYPYAHFCGNEYATNDMYMTELYAKCYIGLNQTNKALDILLPNLMGDGLASNQDVVELISKTLLKSYTKSELSKLYEKALSDYKIEIVKNKKKFYFIFMDRKIEIDSWHFEYEESINKVDAIKNLYVASELYKLLN